MILDERASLEALLNRAVTLRRKSREIIAEQTDYSLDSQQPLNWLTARRRWWKRRVYSVTNDPETNELLKRAAALHRESQELAAQSQETLARLKALFETIVAAHHVKRTAD